MICPPEAQGNKNAPKPSSNRGKIKEEGGEVPGKPAVALTQKVVYPQNWKLQGEDMQKRKKCIPTQSRKGRVDKARLRQTKPHVNKYKTTEEK